MKFYLVAAVLFLIPAVSATWWDTCDDAYYFDYYDTDENPQGYYTEGTGDYDWFEVDLDNDGDYGIYLYSGNGADFDLRVYDECGESSVCSSSSSGDEDYCFIDDLSGDVYIRVYAWDSPDSDDYYELMVYPALGNGDYCDFWDYFGYPCDHGEWDCDTDGECDSGLDCIGSILCAGNECGCCYDDEEWDSGSNECVECVNDNDCPSDYNGNWQYTCNQNYVEEYRYHYDYYCDSGQCDYTRTKVDVDGSSNGDSDFCDRNEAFGCGGCDYGQWDCDTDGECSGSLDCVRDGGSTCYTGYECGCCNVGEEWDSSNDECRCVEEATNNYRCSGDTRQRQWLTESCDYEWRDYEECDDSYYGGWTDNYCYGDNEVRRQRTHFTEYCEDSTATCELNSETDTETVSQNGDGDFCSERAAAGCTCGYERYDCDWDSECSSNLDCVGSTLCYGNECGCCNGDTELWNSASHNCVECIDNNDCEDSESEWMYECTDDMVRKYRELYDYSCQSGSCSLSSTTTEEEVYNNGDSAFCEKSLEFGCGGCEHSRFDCDNDNECADDLTCMGSLLCLTYECGCCYEDSEFWNSNLDTCVECLEDNHCPDDYTDPWTINCEAGFIERYQIFHDYSCDGSGNCEESTSQTNYESYSLGDEDYCEKSEFWGCGLCTHGQWDCDEGECAEGLECVGPAGDYNENYYDGCCNSGELWDEQNHLCYEGCEDGWLDNYDCSGSWVTREYQYVDCHSTWEQYEYCDNGCADGVCLSGCTIPDGSGPDCDCDSDADCPSGYFCDQSDGYDACELIECQDECDVAGDYFCSAGNVRYCYEGSSGCLESSLSDICGPLEYCDSDYDPNEDSCVQGNLLVSLEWAAPNQRINKQAGDTFFVRIITDLDSVELSWDDELDSLNCAPIQDIAGEEKCYFAIDSEASPGYYSLMIGPQELRVKVLAHPFTIYVTSAEQLFERYQSETEVKALLQTTYQEANEQSGVVYLLEEEI